MNNKMLTIATLACIGCWSIRNYPNDAYAGGHYNGDSSETNTNSIKQKNSGGDGSTNINCADNDIKQQF